MHVCEDVDMRENKEMQSIGQKKLDLLLQRKSASVKIVFLLRETGRSVLYIA
jgi:hypothetical protein